MVSGSASKIIPKDLVSDLKILQILRSLKGLNV